MKLQILLPVFALLVLMLFFSGCTNPVNSRSDPVTASQKIHAWKAGQTATYPITIAGGSPPYSCAVAKGSVPQGFALQGCSVTGTAPQLPSGTTKQTLTPFTVNITDSANPKASTLITLTITVEQSDEPLPTPLTVEFKDVDCNAEEECNVNLVANVTGGTPPYRFRLDASRAGRPPEGTVVGTNGYLTGTPTTQGTVVFSVCATDATGTSACGETSVFVQPPRQVESTYTGSFSARGTYSRNYPDLGYSCSFDDTITGTITINMFENTEHEVFGTGEVSNGLFDSRTLSSPNCVDSQVPWSGSGGVTGTTSDLSFSSSFTSAGGSRFTGAFTGSVDGESGTGQIVFTSIESSGSASATVTLTKTG